MTEATKTFEELKAELEALKEENKYLNVLDNLPTVQGTDAWGNPRGPLTEEDKARFKAGNARNGARKEATKENMEMLSLAAQIHNLRNPNPLEVKAAKDRAKIAKMRAKKNK